MSGGIMMACWLEEGLYRMAGIDTVSMDVVVNGGENECFFLPPNAKPLFQNAKSIRGADDLNWDTGEIESTSTLGEELLGRGPFRHNCEVLKLEG